VIDELVDGETVVLGDTQSFEYFETHQNELPDRVHPNSNGYQHLGEFRAEAIKSILEYQITPNAYFLSGNTHTL
jgi:lysophospholipase L1-like esterase